MIIRKDKHGEKDEKKSTLTNRTKSFYEVAVNWYWLKDNVISYTNYKFLPKNVDNLSTKKVENRIFS